MKKHTALYDGECSFCVLQMKVLTWLDWRKALVLVPFSDPRVGALAPQLGRGDLQEAMHCVTPEGRIYRGARAIRCLALRVPLLVPLALVLWLPGAMWVAEPVYRWVSAHRQGLSRAFGCKQACAVIPARERERDSAA